ncbi:hypothetical protein BAE39_26905 [Mesorhizobium loti]|uniref:Radical SAM protein n=1 Tax=Rhizobium loti TaxID=381 RepID=A0A1A5HN39_RHILI|nr:hypothetical protein BAE39_26905 [Mesorhizobium loti]
MARPDLSFHVLTNGQHFDLDDWEAMSRIDRGRVVWGIPLYSCDPAVHDEIVGKAGAHAQLLENLALMCRLGAQVELRTVLMRPNADGLPLLARFIISTLPFIRTWAVQMENIGFGRMNWRTLFYDSSEGFDVVGRSIDLVRSRGIDAGSTISRSARYRSHTAIWRRLRSPTGSVPTERSVTDAR